MDIPVDSIVLTEAHAHGDDVAAADFEHRVHCVPAADHEDAVFEGHDAMRCQR